MKKLTLFFLILFTIILTSIKFSNSESIKEVGYIKVYTSSVLIYDDGIYRTQYAPFYILNEDRKIILKVGSTFDEPSTIALNSGTYYIVEDAGNSFVPNTGIKITISHSTVKTVFLN